MGMELMASRIAFPRCWSAVALMRCRIAYRCGGSAGIARMRSPASRAP